MNDAKHIERLVVALLGVTQVRFPHAAITRQRLNTAWRLILTDPPSSKVLDISDDLLHERAWHEVDIQTWLLESGAISKMERAINTQRVLLLPEGPVLLDA